jgi:hypothetical protein
MAELLGATEALFETDFAIMNAHQDPNDGPTPGGFVGSAPGGVAGMCGTKYAEVSARAERWSSRPEFDNSWEDVDELPFSAIADCGPLRLYGFDSPPDDGLDLDGFGAGRVLVMARGRHRYGYSDHDNDAVPPEEWLLRFFPEAGPARPLEGPPRRLAGVAPFGGPPKTGWAAALHAWSQTGWHSHFASSHSYYAIYLGLSASQRALTVNALAEVSFPYIYRVDPPARGEDSLAVSSGRPTATLGEAIDALRELQLLLPSTRDGQEVLIPNPDPGLVWERIELSDDQIKGARQQIGYTDFRQIAEDISIAMAWVPNSGLHSTVRAMALRWSTTPADIRGGLELLATSGLKTEWATGDRSTDDDTPLVLSMRRN